MKYRIILVAGFLVALNVFGETADPKDFRYNVSLNLKDDASFIGGLTEIFSESEIRSEIKKLRVFSKQNETVSSMTALNDRLKKDAKTIHRNLHTLGYYNATVKYDIDVDQEGLVHVTIKVNTGNKFNLRFTVLFKDQDEDFNKKYSEIFHEQFKSYRASMPEMRSMIEEIIYKLQCIGFYDPAAFKKKVFIDYKNEEAFLEIQMFCGRKMKFGDTTIEAFPGINQKFIQNRLGWQTGDVFSQEKIDITKQELRNTQIFSGITVEPDDLDDSDSVRMNVKVKEEKKHMLDISLMYKGARNMNFEKSSQASKGVKSIVAKLSWTRLNTFGNGERLTFNAEGTPVKASQKRVDYAFETILVQPDVFVKNAFMKYLVSHRQELTNVFFRKTEQIDVRYEFPLSSTVGISVGGVFETNYIDSDSVFYQNTPLSKYYDAISIPVTVVLDKTDDFLNPASGYKLELTGKWTMLTRSLINDLKTYGVDFSYNYALDKLKKNVLSFKIKHKGILSGDIDNIPIDKRFYGGGFDSVRGYGNQMATELVKGVNVTMGGKSIWEASSEYRRKINNDWGAVMFVDGARVVGNKSKYFEIDKKRNFFSAGVGIRYYTRIGPIRLDFAFPINRRKGVDSKMQFIMGLGQAF